MNTGKNGLSRRLQAVADLVSPGKRVCDVGCDHGYVSIYLIESGRADAVLAMDVNRGPLERARINVEKHGLTGYITLRLSNGLDAYRTGEAQSLVIAGMGGRLMQSILTKDKEKTEDFEELILQPQSELILFRKFLRTEGYTIVQEEMILEGGKFYPMMKHEKSRYVKYARQRDVSVQELAAGSRVVFQMALHRSWPMPLVPACLPREIRCCMSIFSGRRRIS